MEQTTAAVQAVDQLKAGPYKATAIKVELEAQLYRYSWETSDCHEYMMNALEPLGLSEAGQSVFPLVFARTYNDGSVDTEFTFTLMLKDSKAILLLPKIIEIWNAMCQEAQGEQGLTVAGAGMHMALLNSSNGYYPDGGTMNSAQIKRFYHFQKSLTLMLPALYFLATHNEISRGLTCRYPQINISEASHGHAKFNAITYKGGALEYRIFDTCYDQPDAILDNVVVIANTMRYWTDKYLNPKLTKVANGVPFGVGGSNKLERFYVTVEQLELLNAGLKLLKPSYRTIKELKAERKFTLKKADLGSTASLLAEAKLQYEEYMERVEESKQRIIRSSYSASDKQNALARLVARVVPEKTFLKSVASDLRNRDLGQWALNG